MDEVDLELRQREWDEREARRVAYEIEQRERAEREAAEELATEEALASSRLRRIGGSFIVPDREPEPTPKAAPVTEQTPPQYRVMSAEERAPWDAWLKTALDAQRTLILNVVSHGLSVAINDLQKRLEKDIPAHFVRREEFDQLRAELLEVRGLIHQRKWWNR